MRKETLSIAGILALSALAITVIKLSKKNKKGNIVKFERKYTEIPYTYGETLEEEKRAITM